MRCLQRSFQGNISRKKNCLQDRMCRRRRRWFASVTSQGANRQHYVFLHTLFKKCCKKDELKLRPDFLYSAQFTDRMDAWFFVMIIIPQRGDVSAHCTTAPTLFETQHLCKGAHNLKGSSWLSSSFCGVFFLSFSVCLSRCTCKEVWVRRRGRKSRRRRKEEEGFSACGNQTDNFNVIGREDQRCGEPLFFLLSHSGFLKGGGSKSSGFETHHHHHHRQ